MVRQFRVFIKLFAGFEQKEQHVHDKKTSIFMGSMIRLFGGTTKGLRCDRPVSVTTAVDDRAIHSGPMALGSCGASAVLKKGRSGP